MAVTDRNGIHIAARTERPLLAEVNLVHDMLLSRWIQGMPMRILRDKVYDSDKLDAELAERGVGMTWLNKINSLVRTQDCC